MSSADYAMIGDLVMTECDSLDGVEDNYITVPTWCKPDLSSLSCAVPYANQSACLRPEQIDTMYTIWAGFRTQTDAGFPKGTYIFPGFEPGAEASPAFSVSGVPFGPAPAWYEFQVLNKTDPTATFSANETELERLYKIGVETDPGMTNAGDPNIQEFLKHGKLLTYVGLADTLIPTGSTLMYREMVRKALGYPTDLQDSYRTFTSALAMSFRFLFASPPLIQRMLPALSSRHGTLQWRPRPVELWRPRPATGRDWRRRQPAQVRRGTRHDPRYDRLGGTRERAGEAHWCAL